MALSVFPELMDRIDPADPEASLRILDDYVRYIVERTEFALKNSFKTTTGLGETTGVLSETVREARGEVDALSESVTELADDLDGKVDKVEGKGLSANDYTDADKDKLAGIAAGAEVNVIDTVQVNGTALAVTDKAVDVTVPTKVSDLTNDSGFQTAVQVQTAAANAVAGVLSEASLFDLTPAVFQTNQTGISVNSGTTNLRTADLIRNYLSSEGHDLGGSTFRSLCLTSGRVVSAATTGSSFALYKTDFRPVPKASAAKLILTLRRFRANVGTTSNPPQIYVATYDASGKIWWASLETSTLGYYRQRYAIDPKVFTTGNLCVFVQFRRPTHTIQATFVLDVVAADSPVAAPGTNFAALEDSGFIAQEQT